jgi:hypothetical protein
MVWKLELTFQSQWIWRLSQIDGAREGCLTSGNGWLVPGEELGQRLQDIVRFQSPGYHNGQAFPRVLIQDRQHP